jgi:hypothetical protein
MEEHLNQPLDDDAAERDRGSANEPKELGIFHFANAASWMVFGTMIAGAIIMMIVGLVLFANGQRDGVGFIVCGAGAAWLFRRMLKGALADHRPVAERYSDEEDDDDGEELGNEYWRVPGYGSDSPDRS